MTDRHARRHDYFGLVTAAERRRGRVTPHQPAVFFSSSHHSLPLAGLYTGATAFVVCGGPSATPEVVRQVEEAPGVVVALNNAVEICNPQLWVGLDTPSRFLSRIWEDPRILKFFPLAHAHTPLDSDDPHGPTPQDAPGMVFIRRNDAFDPQTWFDEDTINWGAEGTDDARGGKSTLIAALRILCVLGFTKIVLVGADFHMTTGAGAYAHSYSAPPNHAKRNNNLYGYISDVVFAQLASGFAQRGIELVVAAPSAARNVAVRPLNEILHPIVSSWETKRAETSAGRYDAHYRDDSRWEPRSLLEKTYRPGMLYPKLSEAAEIREAWDAVFAAYTAAEAAGDDTAYTPALADALRVSGLPGDYSDGLADYPGIDFAKSKSWAIRSPQVPFAASDGDVTVVIHVTPGLRGEGYPSQPQCPADILVVGGAHDSFKDFDLIGVSIAKHNPSAVALIWPLDNHPRQQAEAALVLRYLRVRGIPVTLTFAHPNTPPEVEAVFLALRASATAVDVAAPYTAGPGLGTLGVLHSSRGVITAHGGLNEVRAAVTLPGGHQDWVPQAVRDITEAVRAPTIGVFQPDFAAPGAVGWLADLYPRASHWIQRRDLLALAAVITGLDDGEVAIAFDPLAGVVRTPHGFRGLGMAYDGESWGMDVFAASTGALLSPLVEAAGEAVGAAAPTAVGEAIARCIGHDNIAPIGAVGDANTSSMKPCRRESLGLRHPEVIAFVPYLRGRGNQH